MSLIPCDTCRQRVPEKLCQVTWAWYRTDGHRVAYRQRMCTACFASRVLPMDVDLDYVNGLTCPVCHIDTEDDMDPCYATAFLPGQGKLQLELATCAGCAVKVRGSAQENATKLEDGQSRGASDSSPSTPTTREAYWAALGINRRADSE